MFSQVSVCPRGVLPEGVMSRPKPKGCVQTQAHEVSRPRPRSRPGGCPSPGQGVFRPRLRESRPRPRPEGVSRPRPGGVQAQAWGGCPGPGLRGVSRPSPGGVSRSRPRGSRPRPKRGVQTQAAGCVQAQAQGVQVYLTSRTVLLLPFESANGGFTKYTKLALLEFSCCLKLRTKER